MDEDDCECEEGAPAWMATFSDMATLLLTFFVLLLSFANMDIENFKMALGSVKEAFGVNHEVKGDFMARSNSIVELSDTPAAAVHTPPQEDYNEVTELRRYIQQRGMQNKVNVAGSRKGIILRVKDVALFETGSDQLTADSKPVLDLVADLFGKSQAVLSIEGHTDNIPISRARFPSNWELSAARSTAVIRHYIARDFAKARLSLAGYGELRPIASNDTKEGRSQNRRVEFVFVRPHGKKGRMFRLAKANQSNETLPDGRTRAPGDGPTNKGRSSPTALDAPESTAGDKQHEAAPTVEDKTASPSTKLPIRNDPDKKVGGDDSLAEPFKTQKETVPGKTD